jgi:hypothetical protein
MKNLQHVATSRAFRTACLALAALALAAAQAQAQSSTTATLSAVADIRILTVYPDTNFNTGLPSQVSVFTGGGNLQRSLIQFDLSSLPTGESVQSATLTLYSRFEDGKGNYGGATMGVYRLAHPWSESQATWNISATATPWVTAGGDFVGTTGVQMVSPYATSNAQPSGDYVPVTWDITTLANEWYTGQHANNGLLLMSGQGNNLCFWSREYNDGVHPTGYWAPQLNVTLTPEPATLTLLALGGAAVVARRRKK